MAHAADRIRNVALVGHRGSGKTSLHEALLFEAGAITRMGSVGDGTTVSDADEDEQSRGMSISASLASFEWRDTKVNLLDTPGDPSFVADALSALRVCESAVFVVNGVMGVEVGTTRLWERAAELDLAQEYREKLMDEVAENSEALMERYLEGEEISHDEIVTALEDGTDHASAQAAGSSTPASTSSREAHSAPRPRAESRGRTDAGATSRTSAGAASA